MVVVYVYELFAFALSGFGTTVIFVYSNEFVSYETKEYLAFV
jgi:hypothetical protein